MFGLGLTMVCLGLSGLGGMTAYYFMDKGKSNNSNNHQVAQVLNTIQKLMMELELSSNKEVEEVTEEEIHEPAKVISLDEVFSQYEQED